MHVYSRLGGHQVNIVIILFQTEGDREGGQPNEEPKCKKRKRKERLRDGLKGMLNGEHRARQMRALSHVILENEGVICRHMLRLDAQNSPQDPFFDTFANWTSIARVPHLTGPFCTSEELQARLHQQYEYEHVDTASWDVASAEWEDVDIGRLCEAIACFKCEEAVTIDGTEGDDCAVTSAEKFGNEFRADASEVEVVVERDYEENSFNATAGNQTLVKSCLGEMTATRKILSMESITDEDAEASENNLGASFSEALKRGFEAKAASGLNNEVALCEQNPEKLCFVPGKTDVGAMEKGQNMDNSIFTADVRKKEKGEGDSKSASNALHGTGEREWVEGAQ
uniref:Uncharacterized protein n=1 Tax=Parascaris equorum TaxID=6256 RepID=A0A914RRI6_PAREQ